MKIKTFYREVPGEDASEEGATPIPKRVYLLPKDLRHSAHHTAYCGEGPIHDTGGGAIYKLEFIKGVAENVPEALFQRFADLGIAGLEKPSEED